MCKIIGQNSTPLKLLLVDVRDRLRYKDVKVMFQRRNSAKSDIQCYYFILNCGKTIVINKSED